MTKGKPLHLHQKVELLEDRLDAIQLTPGPQGTAGVNGAAGLAGSDGADGEDAPNTQQQLDTLSDNFNTLLRWVVDTFGMIPPGLEDVWVEAESQRI